MSVGALHKATDRSNTKGDLEIRSNQIGCLLVSGVRDVIP